MKLTEILKCAKAGISTDEIKAIQELDDVSVDDAIELVKAGYKAEDLKDLVKDEEKETPPETPPKEKEKDPETPPKEKTSPANDELDKLKAELEKKTKDLEQAQLSNTKKDIGTGEKPDPEKELAKLFAEL